MMAALCRLGPTEWRRVKRPNSLPIPFSLPCEMCLNRDLLDAAIIYFADRPWEHLAASIVMYDS